MVSSSSEAVQLLDIKGIGPAKQQRLQTVGVTTVTALSGYDPEQLYEQLAATGRGIAPGEIAQWIKQAKTLAAKAATAAQANAAREDLESLADEGIRGGTAEPSGKDRQSDLQTLRGSVWLRLSVDGHADHSHGEAARFCLKNATSGDRVSLSAESHGELFQWCRSQLQTASTAPSDPRKADRQDGPAAPGQAPETRNAAFCIDIMEVGVALLEDSGVVFQVGHSIPRYLPKGQPFTITVGFRVIAGDEQISAEHPLLASAQFNVRNRLTGEVVSLGVAQGNVSAAGVEHWLQSPLARLSASGVYQLQAIVTLQNVRSAAGYRELQLVQVL
ncbi:hypothetical protein C7271_12270 [filamentous cyanobacterium CCP5]|nr:hypothetical protein C7271_12270 [filamentous cyanobacterium CCP5]